MNGLDTYSVMKSIADRGLRNQVKRDGDYITEDGILICGKCGEPRQKCISISCPTSIDPNATKPLKITTQCQCDREKEKAEQNRRDAERELESIRRLKIASLMDERFQEATFSVFQRSKYNERAMKICRSYADRFDVMFQKNQGLLLWGNVGTGKSFAAACIANALLEKKVPVIMTSFVKVLEVIQSSKDQETSIINRLSKTKLVIFDDLGAERSTDYALEKVYNIIDTRYREKLPMILTTNLTIDQMKSELDIRYARIYDRIFECCYPLQFTGPSWRKKEASKRFDEMEKLLEI